jgi:hypothetical protein
VVAENEEEEEAFVVEEEAVKRTIFFRRSCWLQSRHLRDDDDNAADLTTPALCPTEARTMDAIDRDCRARRGRQSVGEEDGSIMAGCAKSPIAVVVLCLTWTLV